MKKFIIYAFILWVVLLGTGCKKSFDSLYYNPNKPVNVPPDLLLNGILNDMYDAPFSDYEKWCQYFLSNYDYYGNNRYDFGSGATYTATLKNVQKMEEEAMRLGLPPVNGYSSLALFFKAYFFTKMSFEMGDIPMSEGILGTANITPAYDEQKLIFQTAFSLLDSANARLAEVISNGGTIQGDIYFSNNLSKWQKVINTFRLRLLIQLSKKLNESDLNIQQQFATIVNNPTRYPIMQSADDNLQFVYVNPTNKYPNNPENFGFDALRVNCSATYVGLLTSFHDPRVYVTAEPASALIAGGLSPLDFSAFVGADPGEDLGIMYNKTTSGYYSLLNRYRYYQTFTGEPSIQIGYPEMCFTIGEAINRGWISSGPLGGAEEYYKEGIKASMASYNIPESGNFTVYFYKSGSPGKPNVEYNTYTVNFNFNDYYNQPLVKYAGNNTTGLTQILQQKYLALFRHSGLESYYTWRRTGVPTFTTGPGTGNSGRIALRFQYPYSERTANIENYQQALDRQYNGNDDINGIMWLLK